MNIIHKVNKKPKLRKSLRSKWSLKEPLYLDPTDKRYKCNLNQLKTNGFSDSETWSLYSPIAQFILPRLIRFREITIGYPVGLSMKEWHDILDQMIFAFDWVLNCEEPKYDKLTTEEINSNWVKYQRGMELFAKWFRDLWW